MCAQHRTQEHVHVPGQLETFPQHPGGCYRPGHHGKILPTSQGWGQNSVSLMTMSVGGNHHSDLSVVVPKCQSVSVEILRWSPWGSVSMVMPEGLG